MQVISLGIIEVASPGTPVSIGSAVALVVGSEVGNFDIVSSTSDTLAISLDLGVTVQTVTLTAGASRSASQVASDINGQTTGVTAFAAGGKVAIMTNSLGSNVSLSLEAVTHSGYSVLGFTTGTYYGSNGQACAKLRLTPLKGNNGDVYIGNAVNFDKTTGVGLVDRLMKPLSTPSTLDSFVVEAHTDTNTLRTKEYFIDADNADDGVMASIWVA